MCQDQPSDRLRVTIRMFLHVLRDGLKTGKRSSNDLLAVSSPCHYETFLLSTVHSLRQCPRSTSPIPFRDEYTKITEKVTITGTAVDPSIFHRRDCLESEKAEEKKRKKRRVTVATDEKSRERERD